MLLKSILLLINLILYFIPEVITLLIASDSVYIEEWKQMRKEKIVWDFLFRLHFMRLLVISICHFIFYCCIHYFIFNDWNFVNTIHDIILMQVTYQQVGYIAWVVMLCTVFAVILGLILKKVLKKKSANLYEDPMLSMRRKSILLLLFSITGIMIIIYYSVATSGIHKIVINEVCSRNATILLDDDGTISDYVELYNTGRLSCEIKQLYLSDDPEELQKYEIPANILDAGKYLIITLNNSNPFAISDAGETVYLSTQDGEVIDQIDCTALSADTSYCRIYDGSPIFEIRTCTPGISNEAADAVVSIPLFSHEAGFYEDEFDLVISAGEGMTVYYTLDGSVPTKESILYDEPIHIDDASANPNVWSMHEDFTVSGTRDILLDYMVPDFCIDKCTMIRAICVDKSGNESSVNSASYFVGYKNKTGYERMNVLSMMTDANNLFDYDTGIYVTGRIYDDYEPQDSRYWWWNTNYSQRGREWEREACLQFFDTDGRLILTKDAGIRMQGGASRASLPRSFKFYARKEYDGSNRFEANLFGNVYEPQRMILFAGGNERELKLRDYLINTVSSNRSYATMDFVPYVLFLNGEYWGCYWLTERYDEEYLEYYYGVDDNNVVMIKNGRLAIGNEEDMLFYDNMKSFIISADLSIDENYKKACELIDVESIIDYYAAEIYIARYGDWPTSNFALWRTREIQNDTYSDGKWRWMLFDVNGYSMKSDIIEADTLAITMENDPFFASLMENEEFRIRFVSVILDMAETEFLPDNVLHVIDYFKELMQEPIEKEYARFYGSDNNQMSSFEKNVEDVKDFFTGRYTYIKDYFANYFDENVD